jgi:hypothetical protein
MSNDADPRAKAQQRQLHAMPLHWSGRFMPKDGQRVRVTYGNLGPGRVIGYFAARGELGVQVRLDPPPWAAGEPWTKDIAGRYLVNVFGHEIEPEDSL